MEIRKYENTTLQNLWDGAKAALREVYNNTDLPQERRKISNTQHNITTYSIKKRRTNKVQIQQKKIIKIREEISETCIKMQYKTKSSFFKRINKINKSLPRLTKKKKGRT